MTSNPEEDEDDMLEDNDSTCSEVVCEIDGDGTEDGEGEVADVVVADANRDGDETRGEDEEEEDFSDDFFDAGEGTVLAAVRLSLRTTSESGQSRGSTEDGPVGPVITVLPALAAQPLTYQKTQIDHRGLFFTHDSISSVDSANFHDDKELVDQTPIPASPLELAPPGFPPQISSRKLNRLAAVRGARNGRSHAPAMCRARRRAGTRTPRRVPQMITPHLRDGCRPP